MFKTRIIAIGKFKEPALQELEREYLKRLRPYSKVTIDELKEVGYKNDADVQRAQSEEAELVLRRINEDAVVILLDEHGVQRDSVAFAEFIERIISFGLELVFVIGSSTGTAAAIRERANHTLSLGLLTFTHNFARVILEEQLYRACTIIYGRQYHK